MNPEEYFNSQNDWDLTQDEWNHINEGLIDPEKGRVVSPEEFWNLLKNG